MCPVRPCIFVMPALGGWQQPSDLAHCQQRGLHPVPQSHGPRQAAWQRWATADAAGVALTCRRRVLPLLLCQSCPGNTVFHCA